MCQGQLEYNHEQVVGVVGGDLTFGALVGDAGIKPGFVALQGI